jgi:peptide deformylase
MSIKSIIQWPDPILSIPSDPVDSVGIEEKEVISDMIETMKANFGLGISAPQIGVLKKIAVIDMEKIHKKPDQKNLVMINPKIIDGMGDIVAEEGCLSFPGTYVPVQRASLIIVEYTDEEGERKSRTSFDLESIAIQHEVDHLEGRLIVDSLPQHKRSKILKEIYEKKLSAR